MATDAPPADKEPSERLAAASENPLRTVWALAWPAVALNALQTINALLDSAFLDKTGEASLTAIGGTTTTVFLFVSISMAVGVAATAIVARAFGAGNHDEVVEGNRRLMGFSVVAGFVTVALLMLLAPISANLFLPENAGEAKQLAVDYLRIVAWFLPPVFVIQALAGSLRGIGDTKSPMVISGLQILLHILLNILFIFPSRSVDIGGSSVMVPGLGLGLAGAGWSIVVSGWVAGIVYMVWCARTPLGAVMNVRLPGAAWTRRIMNLAAPAALMSVVRVTSLMAFTVVLANVPNGKEAIAGMRPGFSIESLAFMPAFGLAIAASALVGQSMGMGRPKRAASLGWMAAHQAGLVSTVVAIFLFIFADQIAHAVVSEQVAISNMTADYLRYVALTETLFGYAMVLISAQQGAGDTKRPFWLTLLCMWGFRVPTAAVFALGTITVGPLVLSGFGWGAEGCWAALALTQGVQGFLSMYLWNKGDWQHATV